MGHTSGMAVPYFVIDAPGGGGKVRLLPNTVIEHNDKEVIIKNFEGKTFHYPQPADRKIKPRIIDPTVSAPSEKLCEMA
jgi:lysine 2,3-aminomutase